MLFLVLQAYMQLIRFDLYVSRGTFAVLYQKVRDCAIRENTAVQSDVERICSAVDLACIWYWKEVLCLQRSACYRVLAETARRAGPDGHRRPADSFQSPRLGRSQRTRRQRQALYARNVFSARQVLGNRRDAEMRESI